MVANSSGSVGSLPKRLHWWVAPTYYSRNRGNFGDMLSPILLARVANIATQWAPPAKAELVCVGSLLQRFPRGWAGTILGTGLLFEDAQPDLSRARVLALRGALTAARLRVRDVALGDPVLLVSALVDRPPVQHKLGVVPHWSDAELANQWPDAYVISPLTDDPLSVVLEIASCERIVSSSLHGLVVADAFGIPRWAADPTRQQLTKEGGMFKYHDYQSVFGSSSMRFRQWYTAPAQKVEALQRGLLDAFDRLRS